MKYPGGKGKCFQQIINILPPHSTYIETHLGGGAVLRNKHPAAHSIGIDKDEQVISFWRINLPDLAEYIHGDAVDFLRSYPFQGTELVYCDPPYLPSTRKRIKVYHHDLTEADHRALLDTLVHLPCSVVISGYASGLYDGSLGNWGKLTFSTKAHDGIREECLWFNYRVPHRLHDMRYFGANYRERQNFKRRMDRLRTRISGLSLPEQHDLNEWLSAHLDQGDAAYANLYVPRRG